MFWSYTQYYKIVFLAFISPFRNIFLLYQPKYLDNLPEISTVNLNNVHGEFIFVENYYQQKISVDNTENVILQFIYREHVFLLNEGVKFMSNKDKDYDKQLLKMLNDKTKSTIIKVIKDYLSQRES